MVNLVPREQRAVAGMVVGYPDAGVLDTMNQPVVINGRQLRPVGTVESLRDRPQPDVAPGVLLHTAFVHRVSPCPDSMFILAVAPGSSWSLRSRGRIWWNRSR